MTDGSPLSADEAARLVHELQVHQVELERQNEELRRTRHDLETQLRVADDLYESAPAAYVTLDSNGLIVRANAAAATLFEAPADELRGRQLKDRVAPDDRSLLSSFLRDALAGNAAGGVDLEISRPGGATAYVRASGLPTTDGRECRLILIDITERRSVERALAATEARYRMLFDSSPVAMWVVDAESLAYLAVNDATVALYGWTRAELLQMTSDDVSRPDEHSTSFERAHRKAGSQGIDRGLRRQRTKGGSDVVLEISGSVIDFDGRRAVLGSGVDVTEREVTRERLLTLSRAVEQSRATVMITDTQGRIQYVNPRFTAITGYESAEVEGQYPRILKSGRHTREFYADLWATITAGHDWHGDFENRRKDGSTFWESASISPVRDASGTIRNFVAVKEDITERRQLADQLRQAQKMESVGQLAGGVAHDFNNELTVITGYAERALAVLPAESPCIRWLEQIRESSDRAATLTSRLLAFGRKQRLSPTVVDLGVVALAAKRFLRQLIRENVEIEIVHEPDLWHVFVDVAQIEHALMNLCTNARDAMPAGGKISITLANELVADVPPKALVASGRYVSISVSDTGCGISDEDVARVFDPFFTTKGVGSGSGLGLAMVHGFVAQSGGHVSCESERGRGTTIRLLLPAHEGTGGDATEVACAEAPTTANAETILVVEDNDGVRSVVEAMLQAAGYTVIVSTGLQAAIAACASHAGPIDLLLTDMVMPGGDGNEVATRVRALRPGVAVLRMSGYSAELLAEGELADVPVVAKPIVPDDLRRKVRAALDGRQPS